MTIFHNRHRTKRLLTFETKESNPSKEDERKFIPELNRHYRSGNTHRKMFNNKCMEVPKLVKKKCPDYQDEMIEGRYRDSNQLSQQLLKFSKYWSLTTSKCHKDIDNLVCFANFPLCFDGIATPICREFCSDVRMTCRTIVPYEWPFNCSRLPSRHSGMPCVDIRDNDRQYHDQINLNNDDDNGDDIYEYNDNLKDIEVKEVFADNEKSTMEIPNLGSTATTKKPVLKIVNTIRHKSPGKTNCTLCRRCVDEGDCERSCKNFLVRQNVFDMSEKRRNHLEMVENEDGPIYSNTSLILSIWSILCLVCSIFSIITIVSGKKYMNSQENSMLYLSICYLVISIGYIIRLIVSHENTACHNNRLLMNIGFRSFSLINQIPTISSCIFSFIIIYFFVISAHLWWCCSIISWNATIVNSKQYTFPIQHLFIWSISFILTMIALLMNSVEGDAISGICSISFNSLPMNFSNIILFFIIPIIVNIMITIIFLIIGYYRLVCSQKKSVDRNDDDLDKKKDINEWREHFAHKKKNEKLNENSKKILIKFGIFNMSHLIPSFLFILSIFEENRLRNEINEKGYCSINMNINGDSKNCLNEWNEIKNVESNYFILILRHLSILTNGIIIAIFLISKDTIKLWKNSILSLDKKCSIRSTDLNSECSSRSRNTSQDDFSNSTSDHHPIDNGSVRNSSSIARHTNVLFSQIINNTESNCTASRSDDSNFKTSIVSKIDGSDIIIRQPVERNLYNNQLSQLKMPNTCHTLNRSYNEKNKLNFISQQQQQQHQLRQSQNIQQQQQQHINLHQSQDLLQQQQQQHLQQQQQYIVENSPCQQQVQYTSQNMLNNNGMEYQRIDQQGNFSIDNLDDFPQYTPNHNKYDSNQRIQRSFHRKPNNYQKSLTELYDRSNNMMILNNNNEEYHQQIYQQQLLKAPLKAMQSNTLKRTATTTTAVTKQRNNLFEEMENSQFARTRFLHYNTDNDQEIFSNCSTIDQSSVFRPVRMQSIRNYRQSGLLRSCEPTETAIDNNYVQKQSNIRVDDDSLSEDQRKIYNSNKLEIMKEIPPSNLISDNALSSLSSLLKKPKPFCSPNHSNVSSNHQASLFDGKWCTNEIEMNNNSSSPFNPYNNNNNNNNNNSLTINENDNSTSSRLFTEMITTSDIESTLERKRFRAIEYSCSSSNKQPSESLDYDEQSSLLYANSNTMSQKSNESNKSKKLSTFLLVSNDHSRLNSPTITTTTTTN
ncbi:hypothetical protein SNEBB_005681 [Seison nebaliae]|nr:hypothetical protein SNEBB_005681 [Seison nebaliae]